MLLHTEIHQYPEMHVPMAEYAPILEKYNISYERIGPWIYGNSNCHSPLYEWELFVSSATQYTLLLLNNIMPLLAEYEVQFRLISNQTNNYSLNTGAIDIEQTGKVLSIYPCSREQAVLLAQKIPLLAKCCNGPVIARATRISNVLYTAARGEAIIKMAKPPFIIEQTFRKPVHHRTIIGKYYVPVTILRSTPKGIVYKAINIRKMCFNWCIIKHGNAYAVDDRLNRTMRDRLLWQKKVQSEVCHFINTPKIIDYFEHREDSFLVMQFIEGNVLHHSVLALLKTTSIDKVQWQEKKTLLDYYLKVVDIIDKLHEKGWIHRDITADNFITDNNGEVYAIDFELAYNSVISEPSPPFTLGTHGYASPEQLSLQIPSKKDDIFSLGALFIFFVSGMLPKLFFERSDCNWVEALKGILSNEKLSNTILACFNGNPGYRPDLMELKHAVISYRNIQTQ